MAKNRKPNSDSQMNLFGPPKQEQNKSQESASTKTEMPPQPESQTETHGGMVINAIDFLRIMAEHK